MKRFLLAFFATITTAGPAQDLGKTGKKGMFTASAGLNFTSRFEEILTDSVPLRHTWFLSGNVTVNLLDWAIPFSYNFSNGRHNYTHPFNRVGLTPTYKWMKVHVGYCSMNFSSWSLTGQSIPGGGLELSPGKWKIRLLHGRLRPAIQFSPSGDNLSVGFRERISAVHTGYVKGAIGVNLYMVHVESILSSLTFIPPDINIKPQDNTLLSADMKCVIRKKWEINMEGAFSHLNSNKFLGASSFLSFRENFQEKNYSALRLSTSYKAKGSDISLLFERVDPGYNSMAASFSQNDVENIRLTFRQHLFHKTLNLSASSGLQRNDLARTRSAKTTRIAGAGMITYIPGKSLSLSLSLNNFSTYTRKNLFRDPSQTSIDDTLSLYQVTRNLAFQMMLKREDAKKHRMLNLNANVIRTGQGAYDPETIAVTTPKNDGLNDVLSIQSSYQWRHKKKNRSVSVNANFNMIRSITGINDNAGLGISYNKGLWSGKGAVLLSSMLHGNFRGNQYLSSGLTNRMGINYRTKRRPSASFAVILGSNTLFNVVKTSTRLNGSLTCTLNI